MVRFLRFQKIFRLYELIQPYLQYSLHVEQWLPEGNILVLAPHADDETIGCGGTIRLHTAAGRGKVHIAFCTIDTEARRKEALAAAEILGASGTTFLHYDEQSLSAADTLGHDLVKLFDEHRPDAVMLPFWLDNHADHRRINEALLDVSREKSYEFLVYAYPVWSPLYPNLMIDIGRVWEHKERAIRCYHSQLATRDYVAMSRSLGAYWAQVKGRGLEVVETFFRASFAEYVKLGKKLNQ